MTRTHPSSVPAFYASLALCAVLAGATLPAQAQGVYKCSIGGKTAYQSSPCPTAGKELEIKPGPTEEQMKEARTRADAEKARAAATPLVLPSAQDNRSQTVARPVDCNSLNKARADAYGRRNATVRASRETNMDQSSAVNRYQQDIQRTESQMISSGCKPT